MTGLAQTPGRTAASMAAVTTILSRKLALAAGLVCLATPVLSSCGFDYATDRPNVISNGGFDQTGSGMRVLATRVVADSNDHGVFIATIALNPTADAAADAKKAPKLVGLAASSASSSQLTASSFSPIAVTSTGAVNLGDPSVGGIPVTGDFEAGAIIPITLTFSDGEKITVQTPVVTQCGDYASVVPQAGTGHGQKGSGDLSSDSTSSTAAPYDCAYPSLPAVGE